MYLFWWNNKDFQCPTNKLGPGLKGKAKGSPYSSTERRVPELIPVLGSQPAGDVSHKPGGRLPLLSARPAVTPATLKRAATKFAAWRTEARWVWTVCLRLLPDSGATAIWVQHANHSATKPRRPATIGGGTYSADTAIAVPLLKVVRLIM